MMTEKQRHEVFNDQSNWMVIDKSKDKMVRILELEFYYITFYQLQMMIPNEHFDEKTHSHKSGWETMFYYFRNPEDDLTNEGYSTVGKIEAYKWMKWSERKEEEL